MYKTWWVAVASFNILFILIEVVPNLEFMVIAVTFHAQSIVKMTTATYKTERVINVIPDGKEQLVK